MAGRSLVSKPSSKLLQRLLDNPELPRFIPRLETATLNALVETVGPEDSGALVTYTTDRQLRAIFDESLWQSLAPGAPEQHRPEEFVRWLFILQEQGEALFAERLAGLGLDYVIMNFAQLVQVVNADTILAFDYEVLEQHTGAAAYAEEFDGYYITAIYDEEWDITRAALVALQAHRPDVFEPMLYGLSQDAGDYLLHDISGDRRDDKESAGFVTPESARSLLELTQLTSLADLVLGEDYDSVSVRYFSQLGARTAQVEPDSGDGDDDSEAPVEPTSDTDALRRQADQRELEDLLVEAEIVGDSTQTLLLSAPEPGAVLPVKAALDRLQALDPAAFARRLSELVYLSNVLIAGTSLNGVRFDRNQAAHGVLATCNLGLSYVGEDSGEVDGLERGLVRLFRIGWKILRQTPGHITQVLIATLRSSAFTEKLYDRRWILQELKTTLDELADHVEHRRLGEAKDCLIFLSLVIEKPDCDALQALIAEFPQFPLEGQVRFLQSTEDLTDADGFVRALGNADG